MKSRIKADISKLKEITVDPGKEPTKVVSKGMVGYKIGSPSRLGPERKFIRIETRFTNQRDYKKPFMR